MIKSKTKASKASRALCVFLAAAVCYLPSVNAAPAKGVESFKLLKDTSILVRMKEAQRLGLEGVKEAVPDLIETLKDESAGVRISAVVSLGYLEDKRAIKPLIKVLENDKSAGVKIMAAQTLGRFRGKKVAKALSDAVEDKDPKIRGTASRALGETGGEAAVEKLLQIAENDADGSVKQSAINALTSIVEMRRIGKDSRTAIEKAIKKAGSNKNKKVRNTAQKALKRLKKIPEKPEKKVEKK